MVLISLFNVNLVTYGLVDIMLVQTNVICKKDHVLVVVGIIMIIFVDLVSLNLYEMPTL